MFVNDCYIQLLPRNLYLIEKYLPQSRPNLEARLTDPDIKGELYIHAFRKPPLYLATYFILTRDEMLELLDGEPIDPNSTQHFIKL